MKTMNQESIDKKGGWTVDEKPKSDNDKEFKGFIKLKEGESTEGILNSKKENQEYKGKMIYYIESGDGEEFWGINGTTDLDAWMKNKKLGDLLKIERKQDKDTGKGNPMQQYEVYHWESEEEKKEK